MQLTTLLVETLKSGKITISQNDKPAVEVNISERKIDADIMDKAFVKKIISSARDASTKKGVGESIRRGVNTIKEVRRSQPAVRAIVEDLWREGVTITVSYKGNRVVTVGSEANSKLTRLVTGTKGIEINNPLKLVEMGI